MPATWARIDGEQHRMSGEPMRQPYEACPLCDSKDFGLLQEHECKAHALYDPGLPPTMRWCLCRNCTHCFVDAYLTKAGFELIAKHTHGQQDPTASAACRRTAISGSTSASATAASSSRPGNGDIIPSGSTCGRRASR